MGAVSLEKLCAAIGIENVFVVDPYDLDDCYTNIKKALSLNAPAVVISNA